METDSTLIINDSVKSVDSATKTFITQIQPVQYKSYDTSKSKIVVQQKQPSDITIKKDTSKIYVFEPWDSIFSIRNEATNLKGKKVFNNITTTAQNKTGGEKIVHKHPLNFPSSTFILSSLLIAFLLLSLSKVTYRKYMRQLMNAVVNYSEATKLYLDRNIMIDRLFLVMNLIFVISGGLFIYFFIGKVNPIYIEKYSSYTLSICFAFIIFLYFYKYFFAKILGFILLKIELFNEYLYSSFLYYKIIGLFLLPISSLLYLVADEFRTGISIFSIVIIFFLLVLSIFRATRIILQKDILLFYWILYLCIIEFLPFLLLYKFLSSYS